MATKRSRPPLEEGSIAPRRGGEPGGVRRLPDAMHRLAAGEDERLRRPRPQPSTNNLRDERERVLIPGVNNKDSRRVYDARVSDLRAALAGGQDAALGQGLLEVSQLRLFRARNVVDFKAFASSVLGMPLETAESLRKDAATAANATAETLPDPLISLWVRTESALREHLDDASVSLTDQAGEPKLTFSVPAAPVPRSVEALSGVGRQAAGLARFLDGAPARQRSEHGGPRDERRQDGRDRDREGGRGDKRGPGRDPR